MEHIILWRQKNSHHHDVYPTWSHNNDSRIVIQFRSICLRKISRDSFLSWHQPTIQIDHLLLRFYMDCCLAQDEYTHATRPNTHPAVLIFASKITEENRFVFTVRVLLQPSIRMAVGVALFVRWMSWQTQSFAHINWHGTNLSYKMHLKAGNRL